MADEQALTQADQLPATWRAGNLDDEDLTPTLYAELRQVAAGYMRRELPGHTLQPTDLVNEALIRLFGSNPEANERSHLVALAARTMRQVLVDHARRKHAAKRASSDQRVPLDTVNLPAKKGASIDILALDEALQRLTLVAPRAAKVVEIRYFGGLTNKETAEALDMSLTSVERDWRSARAWLHQHLKA